MTQQQPITPPPELVQQWDTEGRHQDYCTVTEYIAHHAAQWGADQELEACCLWVNSVDDDDCFGANLRAARRPNPPSVKQQALTDLGNAYNANQIDDTTYENILRALEALPE